MKLIMVSGRFAVAFNSNVRKGRGSRYAIIIVFQCILLQISIHYKHNSVNNRNLHLHRLNADLVVSSEGEYKNAIPKASEWHS